MKKNLLIIASLLMCLTTYAECYIVEGGSGTKSARKENQVLYTGTFTSTDGYVSYSASGYSSGLSIVLQYSTNGGSSWTSTDSYVRGSGSKNTTIPPTANAIRFITSTSNGGRTHLVDQTYSVSNVCVGKSSSLSTSGTLVIPTSAYGIEGYKEAIMTVNYVNLKGETVTVTKENDSQNLFSIEQVSEQTLSQDDCDASFTIKMRFTTAESTPAGDYSCTINVSAGSMQTSFAVNAKVTAADITRISWEQNDLTSLLSRNIGNSVPLIAKVVDSDGNDVLGASLEYISSNEDVVSINGSNLVIKGEGEAIVTAKYTSDNEEMRTSATLNKMVFVSDGKTCVNYALNKPDQFVISAYNADVAYSWSAPTDGQISFDIWKVAAATGESKVTFKDVDGNQVGTTQTYSPNSLSTNASRKTLDIPAGATQVVFGAGGTLNKYIANVQIRQATYLTLSTTDLGQITGENGIAMASVSLSYSNMPTAISAVLEHEETATIRMTADQTVGRGCGSYGNGTINLIFEPKEFGARSYSYEGNILIQAGVDEGLVTQRVAVKVVINMNSGDLTSHFGMVCLNKAITLRGNTKSYTASWNNSGEHPTLELIEVEGSLPANTPALLYNATENTYLYVDADPNEILVPIETNAFTYTGGSFRQDNEAYNYYVLGANGSGVVAFYKYTGTIPPGKVVLAWEKTQGSAAPQRIDIRMAEDIATALVPVWAEDDHAADARFDGQIYTIMGLPVSSMSQPGIYIQNGKKIVVR